MMPEQKKPEELEQSNPSKGKTEPPASSAELSDEDLKRVAGGMASYNRGV